MSLEGVIAANRFGLGPRPGEIARLAADPRGALLAQLDPAAASPAPGDGLPTTAEALELRNTLVSNRKADPAKTDAARREIHEIFAREAVVRFDRSVATATPFRERLVQFWSNHFTIAATKGNVVPFAGVFEREAIAPHVGGRFVELLTAAALHPGMLFYLDQAASIGPDSPVGRRSGRGLNENLAREAMELHTLGVDGGYTQEDVRALAAILTGWTVSAGPAGHYGFDPDWHQPGDKRLLGTVIHEAGAAETDAAFLLLARHPATARHIAAKLVRLVVADDPPSQAVAAIAQVFRDSDGDLAAVSRALVGLDDAWRRPLPKVKTPWELAVALGRACAGIGEFPREHVVLEELKGLGQAPYGALSPAGWPDRAADWLGANALVQRIEMVQRAARLVAPRADVVAMVADTIGPVAPADTLRLITQAPDPTTALTLLFASSEFQRR